jgi:uncharacterized PurR-regulated membrane protein YhhQ (DUF165 family)
MIYAIIYILLIVLANLTAGTLISVAGLQFAVGTIFFGFIFTLRDKIHILKGKHYVYKVIALAVIVNLLFSLLGAFSLTILVASVLAFALSELADTEVFSRLKERTYILRVIGSNAVSIPLDTILFTFIAFGSVWALPLIITVICTDIIVKFITSAVLLVLKRKGDKR